MKSSIKSDIILMGAIAVNVSGVLSGRLADRLALLLICLVSFSLGGGFELPVAAFLLSVILSSLSQIMRKYPYVPIIINAALCFVSPIFFCALPLMLYDSLSCKKLWAVLPAIGAFVQISQLHSAQLAVTVAGAAAAVIIYARVSALEITVNNLAALRDEVAEKNMILAKQNVQIVKAQDNEVHLAALRERERIARDIHDNVGHMLTRSLLQSGALIVLNKDDSLKEPLRQLKDTLDSAMTGIRAGVHDLHDDAIDLQKVLEESCRACDSRFKVKLCYDSEGDIPGKVKLCVAAIVKEGLSNAVKHSGGDEISVVFREHPAFYQLMITDNGSCKGISGVGMGLKNMEERAAGLGGRITFTPSREGFKIFMSAPKNYEDNNYR